MLKFDSDCDWWVLGAVASFCLFILSEVLPILRPVHDMPDDEEQRRVHGVVQFMTLIIRTQWARQHPEIRDMLRFWREVVAEEAIPPSPDSPAAAVQEIELEEAEAKPSSTVVTRKRSSKTSFAAIDEGKD